MNSIAQARFFSGSAPQRIWISAIFVNCEFIALSLTPGFRPVLSVTQAPPAVSTAYSVTRKAVKTARDQLVARTPG
jgi:hypothetical protein